MAHVRAQPRVAQLPIVGSRELSLLDNLAPIHPTLTGATAVQRELDRLAAEQAREREVALAKAQTMAQAGALVKAKTLAEARELVKAKTLAGAHEPMQANSPGKADGFAKAPTGEPAQGDSAHSSPTTHRQGRQHEIESGPFQQSRRSRSG